MSFPLFQFTLSNTIEGTLEIKEPEGWDDGVLKLERNKEYHSLVEYWDQPLTFDDAEATELFSGVTLPGGLSWIKNIEDTQGIGAIITILIKISTDGGINYRQIFLGTLAIDTVKEIDFYKAEYGVLRDDFWAKLINRKNTQVDLGASVDVDGNARIPILPIDLPLPSQKIRVDYYSTEEEGQQFLIQEDYYGQYTPTKIVVDEIEDVFSILNGQNESLPVWILEAKFNGVYTFDLRVEYSGATIIGYDSPRNAVDFFLKKNNESAIEATYTNHIYNDASVYELWAGYPVLPSNIPDVGTCHGIINLTIDLIKGDIVRIYFKQDGSVTGRTIVFWGSNGLSGLGLDGLPGIYPASHRPSGMIDEPTYFRITADTVFEETSTKAFLIKDVFESIVSKITGNNNTIESAYFDSCAGQYATAKGLHIRGYGLSEKPYFSSLDDAWNGINPILNLGMGYIDNENKIEILEKEDFYDSTPVLYLDFVNMIERSYDLDKVIKSVEIGYEKWSAESVSGIDDPQSKRTYTTSMQVVGKEEQILSKFIAASGAIEQTRRNRVELGKDWRLDNDTMIIAVVPGSPEWTPEFSENFALITNLLHPDFRYNIRLSVARNLSRWMNWISGCLQIPYGQEVKFASGEGNFDMTSQLDPSDCEATEATPEPVIDEKGNFAVTDNFLYTPKMYTFDHPLTQEEYDLINQNRKKAIAVSRTNSNHLACFIMKLDYKPTRAFGTFEVLIKSAIT